MHVFCSKLEVAVQREFETACDAFGIIMAFVAAEDISRAHSILWQAMILSWASHPGRRQLHTT